MKIAIIGLSPNMGGVETFIINMYRQLKKDNHQFFFLTAADTICYENEILKGNDKIIHYTPRRNNYVLFRKSLKEIFMNNNFDVFWLNCCSLSCIDELKYAYKTNVPIRIIHSHNSENMGSKLTNLLHLYHKKVIGKYITHSFACSDVAAKWMFPKDVYDKTILLHNSINAHMFSYDYNTNLKIRKQLNISENEIVVGNVGRFHFQKNHIFLLKVFNEYKKINPKVKLVLCGTGDLKVDILKVITKYRINDDVIILENQSNMNEIYQIFDLFLFPSLFEGLPFALIEAQAAGIPCLISDTISREICITNLIYYESLDNTEIVWAEKLHSLETKMKVNTLPLIEQAGYDIKACRESFYKAIKYSMEDN